MFIENHVRRSSTVALASGYKERGDGETEQLMIENRHGSSQLDGRLTLRPVVFAGFLMTTRRRDLGLQTARRNPPMDIFSVPLGGRLRNIMNPQSVRKKLNILLQKIRVQNYY